MHLPFAAATASGRTGTSASSIYPKRSCLTLARWHDLVVEIYVVFMFTRSNEFGRESS